MLNRAHWLHRQAEKAARKGRVEEAVAHHKEAAELLNQLLQTIIDEKVAESVRLQAQLHEKERVILRHQKRKAEKVYRDLESLRKMAAERGSGAGSRRSTGSGDSLQLSIYRKFEETQYLLDQLRIQDDASSVGSSISRQQHYESNRSFSVGPDGEVVNTVTGGTRPASRCNVVVSKACKKPKDDKVIIEELQVVNSHLYKMVDSLFSELSACQRENLELKARIRHLEGQQQPITDPSVISGTAQAQHRSIVVSSAQPSPQPVFKTFKPESPARCARHQPRLRDRGEDQARLRDLHDDQSLVSSSTIAEECDLPPLPPLEMPTFDFGPEA